MQNVRLKKNRAARQDGGAANGPNGSVSLERALASGVDRYKFASASKERQPASGFHFAICNLQSLFPFLPLPKD